MKGVVLAFICSISASILSILFLRYSKVNVYLRTFLKAYVVTMLAYFLISVMTPENLWLIPDRFLFINRSVDLFNGFLIFSLIMHCFIDLSFATVVTGFSTNLMVLIKAKNQLTEEQILEIYRDTDNGVIMNRRLDFLLKGKYISKDRLGYRLSPRGSLIATMGRIFKRLYRMESIG